VNARPGTEFHRLVTVTLPHDQEMASNAASGGQSAGTRPELEPMETNDVLIVGIGTALFALAFVVLLPFHTSLEHSGHGRWLWVALAGTLLGLVGLDYCRRRAARIRKTNAP
jgi:hypothetical protein